MDNVNSTVIPLAIAGDYRFGAGMEEIPGIAVIGKAEPKAKSQRPGVKSFREDSDPFLEQAEGGDI